MRLLRSAFSLIFSHDVRTAQVLVANTTRASVYVTMAGLILRKPVVVHIRDLVEPDAVGTAAVALMRRFVLPRAAGIIANSQASLALVEPYVRGNCVRAVLPSPSGIRPTRTASEAGPVERIGMVARIDPWKGQELLLRAFADACAEGESRLVFFGSAGFGHEDFVADLTVLATELGVADRVEFAGHVEDVPAAIASLDICVQASLRPEPLGQNVLQYLAAGKATIVSGEGGPAEWVTDGENGLTFTPRDQRSLAAALRRLQSDASLRRAVSQGASMTPGLLTDEQIRDQIGAVLREVVGL
jgi:glycosyltransferase involved in cell wall biosynthesis